MDFFTPCGTQLKSSELLTLERAQQIAHAISNSADWQLICAFSNYESEHLQETVVAEVACDGVPSNNRAGIRYRERVAIVVRDGSSVPPEVLALRKGFPLLLHQNATAPDSPRNLCLYFDDPNSVLRTWTAEKHLKRISWWLEMSASELLHAADQPVEQVFFRSPWEVVLPQGFEQNNSVQDDVSCVELIKRQNNESTIILEWANRIKKDNTKVKVSVITLIVTAVVHGKIELPPSTLSGLEDLLSSKGFDLARAIKEKVFSKISEAGEPKLKTERPTLILLRIPVCREEGGEIESVQNTAYICDLSYQQLGLHYDFLHDLDGQIQRFETVTNEKQPPREQEVEITPVSVLYKPSRKKRSIQAGALVNDDQNPKAVLVGVGAFGSAMLDLWVRSGWGRWFLVDNDHIKPHNLVRHTTHAFNIGDYKTHALNRLYCHSFGEEVFSGGRAEDACKLMLEDFEDVFGNNDFIIDVSTTLEFPRLASGVRECPRIISTFLTRDGGASVILCEDAERKIPINLIEAQLYRAIINCDWGKVFGHEGSSYISGNSCRDISYSLSPSKIWSHASIVSDVVRGATNRSDASLTVFVESNDSGERHRFDVELFTAIESDAGEFSVFVDSGLVHKLREMRETDLPNETGGILLGFVDFNIKSIYVVDAVPAPIDSEKSVSHFQRGTHGLTDLVSAINERTSGVVEYLGEWHSHPRNVEAKPSGQDLIQIAELSKRMKSDGLPVISLIVGENSLNIMLMHEEA